MAALPSPTQVAGTHSAIYEAYYNQVDPNGTGAIQALDAARFLKKSRLSDVVLSKIWDLSDPTGKGFLDKAGLFVALKLVALAQAGKDINMSNIHSEAPPPKVGEVPKIPASWAPARPAPPTGPAGGGAGSGAAAGAASSASEWAVRPHERERYSQLFDSLQPTNGLVAGNKVKGVLMESKLPLATLGKIWELADQDMDGMLDRHEFIVAMHLVYKALEKHAVPTSLPPELRAPAPRAPSPAPPRPLPPHLPHPAAAHPAATASAATASANPAPLVDGLLDLSSPPAQSTWVVTVAERVKFDAMFAAADADRDGLVSGAEIKGLLMDSGLPQSTLAHIWALCDRDSVGKLTQTQFALAMWLVERARRGQPPPAVLPPNMVPPAAPPPLAASAPAPIPEPVSLGPQPTPELEAIAREVDALARERLTLEAEVAAGQRSLDAHTAEGDSLQSELDTLTATLKQLENQKGEAQKRLNDLKSQVEKLRSQVSAQEAAAAETSSEVEARRAAAAAQRSRVDALRAELARAEAEAERATGDTSRAVLALRQANIKVSHLEEQARALEAAAEALAAGGPGAAAALELRPAFGPEHLARLVRGEGSDEEPTEPSNGFDSMNGSGFGADPFKDGAFPAADDPFAPKHAQDAFGSDSFAKAFPTDSADPFADTSNKNNNNSAESAWASDPFAVLHAPPRGSSPTPVLPPKKHKTPPPRPAPPRPAQTEKTAMEFTEDPFKDYRYEDPFNIEDPFADVTDSKKIDLFNRPTSVAGFETDDFFASSNINGGHSQEKHSGRVSAPPTAFDPFSDKIEYKPEFKPTLPTITSNDDAWAAWPNDNWADDWGNSKKSSNTSSKPDAWSNNTSADAWADKSDNWAADWGGDHNKNINETWPSTHTLPTKKEKSPKPVKYARSLVNTIGGIGRTRHGKEKKDKTKIEARSSELLPTEDQQLAWAAAESKRLEKEAEARRRQEDAELQLALAISRQEK